MNDSVSSPTVTTVTTVTTPPTAPTMTTTRTHLRFGWTGLLVYALLGIALEALHAWKSAAYLGVGHETRRLMWTLAHAHGVGLSLVHLGFAATLGLVAASERPKLGFASRAFCWASLLIPLGFFLGGTVTYEADPGLGVLLVPIGALLLLIALGRIVWVLSSVSSAPRE